MIGLKTKAEFEKHKEEHMEEIERLDISTLINGHDLFECNLCSTAVLSPDMEKVSKNI